MTCGPGLRTAERTTAQVRFEGLPPWRCGRSERHVPSSVPRIYEIPPSAASARSPRRVSSPDSENTARGKKMRRNICGVMGKKLANQKEKNI